MTGHSLRAAIAAACDLTNPRLSEVDWDEVAAAFVRLRDTGSEREAGLDAATLTAAMALDVVIEETVQPQAQEGGGG